LHTGGIVSSFTVIGEITLTVAVAVVAVTVVTLAVVVVTDVLVTVELAAVVLTTVVLVTSHVAVYEVVCFGATLITLPVWVVDQRRAPPAGQPEAVRVVLVPAQRAVVAVLTTTVSAAGAAAGCGLDAYTRPQLINNPMKIIVKHLLVSTVNRRKDGKKFLISGR
jgi:hypothetical protein